MAQYNGNWYPPTFGMWIVRVRVTSVPQNIMDCSVSWNAAKHLEEQRRDPFAHYGD